MEIESRDADGFYWGGVWQAFRLRSLYYIFNTNLNKILLNILLRFSNCNFRSTEIKTQMVSIGGSVENVLATFPVIWFLRFK